MSLAGPAARVAPEPAVAAPVAEPAAPVAEPAAPAGSQGASRARAYLSLTRPGVLVLVLLSGLPAFVLDPKGPVDAARAAAMLAATALLGGACSAWNALLERDRDALMERTRRRPLVTGALSPAEGAVFATLATLAALGLLAMAGGALAALLGGLTALAYVVGYTLGLKPRSPHATVFGALPGAAAPLIADAWDGALSAPGLWLFALVGAWQMPHFYAITLYRRDEYAAAGFPTMALVAGPRSTRWQSVAWAALLLPIVAAPAFSGFLSLATVAWGLLLTAGFVLLTVRAAREGTPASDKRVFRASGMWLAAVLLTALADGIARR